MTGSATSPRRRERGAALLVAMVGIAVLTALAVDLAYASRVSLQIAANARDELRASYLARSGVALSRLALSFQQKVDEAAPKGGLSALPRVQIWRMVPVGSQLVDSLFPGSTPPAGGAPPEAGFEALAGAAPKVGFAAAIEDEAVKVNAQLDGFVEGGDRKLWSKVQALYQLVCDPRWDPLFEREDAHGVRATREDLLVHLRDWVDEDPRSSGLVAAFAGQNCAMFPAAKPFEDAFGDENQPYDRGDDRYRAKNNRMDSLDELYLVAGVGDAFMAAFGDALTVYLTRAAKWNVNELDPQRLLLIAAISADPPLQPALLDPLFAERLQTLVAQRTLGGILTLKPIDLGQMIAAAGVPVNMNLFQDNPNSPFTDRSDTFRIKSTGTSGDVTAAIDAVVRLETAQQGAPVAAPGKLIHWRED